VREIVIGQFLALQQVLDETKAFLRTVPHGDGNCAVQFHHGGRLDTKQPGVERSDLPPVSGRRGASFGENRRNRKPRDGKPRDQSARFPNGPE
jgi:hypothetical protein